MTSWCGDACRSTQHCWQRAPRRNLPFVVVVVVFFSHRVAWSSIQREAKRIGLWIDQSGMSLHCRRSQTPQPTNLRCVKMANNDRGKGCVSGAAEWWILLWT
mmetsp:Transcript_40914/g.47576  ORF Transcript_40914/g.47576 Transcript_40914/m.47576 type:complete len:102 (+) Transcript_40914:124-429(+)